MHHRPFKFIGMVFSLALFSLALGPEMVRAQDGLYNSAKSSLAGSMQRADTMSSGWKNGHKSRVRIISGDTDFSAKSSSYAGVHLQMAKGWKTYWRSPGDAGVPPTFDWSGSTNLKNIRIKWPAPTKYKDEYSTSIGYKHEVILPVEITAKDKNKPVDIKLRFAYGICADICVPVEKKLNLTIPTHQSGYKSLLSGYRKMVPMPVKTTGKIVNGFSIKKIAINLKGKKPSIIIDARIPADTKKAELYVEASNGFYLPMPSGEKTSTGNDHRFLIDLTKSDPPKGLVGQTLALTLIGNKTGIEYMHKIN